MIDKALKENTILSLNLNVLDEISILLEHVLNISSNYKIDLNREEEIVRIEEFRRYDKSLLNKTMKDARLFTNENNSIYPKKLYQYNYEENVDTYENRFIAYLLTSLKKDMEESYRLLEKEKLPFLKAGVSYGKYGTYSLLNKYAINSLREENIIKENRDYTLSLLRRINNLLQNEFFKRVKKVKFDEVYATNILLNDKDYAYCYTYYLKNKENSSILKEETISSLFTLLKERNKNDLIFDKKDFLSFKRDDFVLSFKKDNKIYLSVLLKSINEKVDYEIDFKINLFVKKLILTYDHKEYLLNINTQEDIYEIILSLLTIVASKEGICPLCKKEIETNSCYHCNSEFLYFFKENTRFAWILNIFALNLEEENYEI